MGGPVHIHEVGPRDGLQNERALIPSAVKIRLVDLLSRTGLRHIEATSFVSPKWVPQLADGAEVMAGISRAPGICYSTLVPNAAGLGRALAARVEEIAFFVSASEGFSLKNINATRAESLSRLAPVAAEARAKGLRLRGYVSCVTDCPYDGPVAPAEAAHMARGLADLGCHEISLGDTIGAATPATTGAMLDAVLKVLPAARLAGHFHDTRGRALENVALCLDRGLRSFDGSVAGLGGCPYAPGAPGNLDTGALADFLAAQGFATGIDRQKLEIAADFARNAIREARADVV